MAAPPPQIAIVGSADELGQYDPPLREVPATLLACEAIGRELARAGYNIVVYSSDPRFIEPHVVRGFLGDGVPSPQSVHVHYSVSVGAYRFAESAERPEAFAYHADASEDWEVSFYRSLARVDGLVVVGGARSAMVAGIIAVTHRVPVVAVAGFGGAAWKVWQVMSRAKDLAAQDELTEMALDHWGDGSAAGMVATLGTQLERLAKERAAAQRERRRTQRRSTGTALVSVALFLAALAGLVAGFGISHPGSTVSFGLLFLAPALAGASECTIRTVFTRASGHRTIAVIALGLVAGGIATVLFSAAQLSTNRDLFASGDQRMSSYRGLLLFSVAVGFVAGFTFDLVYRRLARTDVLGGAPLPTPTGDMDETMQSEG
jgi:hypothetical protein